MGKRRTSGLWLAAGVLFAMQSGGPARGDGVVNGPSQGAIPADCASPQGGGGGGMPSNVVPALQGNPHGVDAISEPSPSPAPPAGGGGGAPVDWSPFIRVLPGGDAADWARSPSPPPP